MRWFLILLYLSMALQTRLHAAYDENESFGNTKEDSIIEDDVENKVQMVIQEEKRNYEDVSGLASKMYRSAFDEACWNGLFVTEQLINSLDIYYLEETVEKKPWYEILVDFFHHGFVGTVPSYGFIFLDLMIILLSFYVQ